MKYLCIAFSVLLMSCSSYIEGLHNSYEKDEQRKQGLNSRNGNNEDSLEIFRSKTGSNSSNQGSGIVKNETPSILRKYSDGTTSKERVKAKDLVDNSSDGSLWSGNNPNNFLFTNDNRKTAGDIVQISVMAKLKNEITMELKKSFPDNPYEGKIADLSEGKDKEKDKEKEKDKDKKKDETSSGGSSLGENGQEKISGIIAEEISREHLLVKGRKSVLFKNRKRIVEVQALVSRKDINEANIISSDAIIENSVRVIK